mgnify:CR=1 FL=1
MNPWLLLPKTVSPLPISWFHSDQKKGSQISIFIEGLSNSSVFYRIEVNPSFHLGLHSQSSIPSILRTHPPTAACIFDDHEVLIFGLKNLKEFDNVGMVEALEKLHLPLDRLDLGGGGKSGKCIKQKSPKSILLADNTQGLITTKQTKP